MDDRKVTRQGIVGSESARAAPAKSGPAAIGKEPAALPLSNSEKKAIEQGKAAVVNGKLVESNVGKVEGRS